MENKPHKDNLEEFFGRLFNDEETTSKKEGWNVPSEDVWEQIQKGLSDKEPSGRVIYWRWAAIAAGFLLLASLFQIVQYNQKINDLTDKLELNEKAVKDIKNEIGNIIPENQTIEQSSKIPNDSSISLDKNKQQKITPTNLNNSSGVITQNEKEAKSNLPIISQTAFNKSPGLASEDLSAKTKSLSLSGKQPDKEAAELLGRDNRVTGEKNSKTLENSINSRIPSSRDQQGIMAPLKGILSFLVFEKNQQFNIPKTLIRPLKKRPDIYLSADYSPVWNEVKAKGFKFGGRGFFPRSERQQKAYSLGLQLGIGLKNNWIVETGLRYTAQHIDIQHSRKIPYSFLQEKLDAQGNYKSELNLSLGSSGGQVETDVVLSRSSATTVENNSTLDLDIAINNSIEYLDFPILIKKQWALGNLGLSLKAGILNRFLIQKSFEFESVESNDLRFQTRSGLVKPAKPRDNFDYSGHYLVGVGVDYAMTPRWSLYLEPTFTRSILPVADFDRASIYSQSKMVQVGLRYQL